MRLSVAIGCLLLILTLPEATATTLVVTFDDLDGGETVTDQYKNTHGVSFSGPGAGDGALPVIRVVGPAIAHSGGRVADISFCFACEFYTPRTVGRLNSTALKVSMFVGYIGSDVGNAPAQVRLTARDALGESLGTSSVTVVQGEPFDQVVSVTSPGGTANIASFELVAEPPNMSQSVGFDDLAIEYPTASSPADFALHVPEGPTQRGPFVDVPITLERFNGSDGPVTLAASGLPPEMSSSFSPNPVVGTGTTSTMRLGIDPNASSSAYVEITINGTPSFGAGSSPRSVTLPVRVIRTCSGAQVEIGGQPDVGAAVPEYRAFSAVDLDSILRSDFVGRVIVPRDQEWEMVDCEGKPLLDIPVGVGNDVELIGERGALGSRPMLYTSYMDEKYPLFSVVGNDVHIEGLNFTGPLPGRFYDLKPRPEYIEAILVRQDTDRVKRRFGHRVTIVDNEFSQWTHAGVAVKGCLEANYLGCARTQVPPDEWKPEWPNLIPDDAGTLLVKGNYFHHNARTDGGYGVVVGGGGYATIEGNVFDHNRHAVSGSGEAYSGYYAHFNYVLAGGYKYGGKYSQHFDMHGTADHGWGGYAGELFEIRNNTIRGDQTYKIIRTRPALQLRGRTEQGAYFNDNVVVHEDLDDAVSLKWDVDDTDFSEDEDRFNFHASGNKFDTDYSTEVAAGDFDGDGRTDVFVANGTGWFYSRSGIRPWEYLHASDKRTKDLTFADIDNDGITDVLYRDPSGNLGFLKSGRLDLELLTTLPVPIRELRSGDFDGDGLTDLFYTIDQQWQIWDGATRTWSPAASSSTKVSEMLFGDFDDVTGTDVAAVRNGAWSYSSGGIQSWAKLNKKLIGSFKDAVAADFDGNGRSDIAFIDGKKWLYSHDGSSPLTVMRTGPVAPLKPLLVGYFDPVDGAASQAQVASWSIEVRFHNPQTGQIVYGHGAQLMVWRGLGTDDGFKELSPQAMR